ncbi:pro-interleukin-16 [Neolamprologus brichardi]|uniref:pro-interleukin-16 n=1 Tax=Neolamprologus brichardi TaxID=32507 RepID=UPI0003EC0574|nr:pro-interleukin-16 [Neolamprologus brichardi]
MNDEENVLEVDDTVTMTPENESETPSELKKAPPVAPKPAWFRQSLRKIKDEQDQKTQAKPSEQTSAASFSRNFGIRSASSATNQSIKQRIHSFETFSSPEAPEKGSNRRPLAPSTTLSPVEKGSRDPCSSYSASNGDNVKNKTEFSREIQSRDPAPSKEEDNIPAAVAPCAIASTSNEARQQTTEKSSEDETPFNQSTTDSMYSQTISTDVESGMNDYQSAPVHDSSEALPTKLESELERVDSETSVRSNQTEGLNPSDGTEEEGKLSRTTRNAAPTTESNTVSNPESESLGKIITFSNQVSQALMTVCGGNPSSTNLQDSSSLDSINQQASDLALDTSGRGFSFSLFTLRECITDRGEGGVHNETASASAHSVISAINSQEIQTMIQEVEALDEETLKQLVDIHVVVLHKDEGAGLGFTIAGGSDLENKAVTRVVEEGREEGSCRSEEPNPAVEEWGAPMSVELEKCAGGVGFTLEGGKGSIHGDRPLVINRIFTGGAAEQSGLQSGDEVLQVQGISLQDMTRFEAWNMIKALPEGPITVVLKRRLGAAE